MRILFLILFCGIQSIHAQVEWELLNPRPTANPGKGDHLPSNTKHHEE